MKARGDMATMTGWYVENMSRQGKKMKPLTYYLTPPKPKTPESGARDVRRMLDRMIAKQEAADGSR